MLVHIKTIVRNAKRDGYAVGSFNVHGLESVLGVARAAARAKSPAIMQVSEGAIKYMGGLEVVVSLVSATTKSIAPKVPIALQLDHGKSLDIVLGCIKAGFSSVHIDASHLPLDENIKITKQVVKIAHKKNVWVQGEVGSIVGGHGAIGGKIDIPLANVDEVISFVEKTGIDTIAAAIGTAHGIFKSQDIKFNLLKGIKERTKKPFILHGGSGNGPVKIKKAIREGVSIINIGTDIKVAFSQTLIENCKNNKKETDPRKLLRPSIEAVEDVTVKHMKLFGSAGRMKI